MNAHAAHADDIGVRIEGNGLDVLIDNLDVPVTRRFMQSVSNT